jgi:hypothetical protein
MTVSGSEDMNQAYEKALLALRQRFASKEI